MKHNLISYLKRSLPIDDDDETFIGTPGKSKTYRSGEVIATGVTLNNQIYYIEKGLVKLTLSQYGAQPLVLSFIGEDRLLAFLSGLPQYLSGMETLEAATDCEIRIIEAHSLDGLYAALPYFKDGLQKIAMLEIAAMLTARSVYHGLNASRKYKKLLDTEPLVAQMALQIDIASYLEVTPESLSRIRKNLLPKNNTENKTNNTNNNTNNNQNQNNNEINNKKPT